MNNLHIPSADSYTRFEYVSQVAMFLASTLRLSCHLFDGHKCVAWDCVQELSRQVGVSPGAFASLSSLSIQYTKVTGMSVFCSSGKASKHWFQAIPSLHCLMF